MNILITNATIVNEGSIEKKHIVLSNKMIEDILPLHADLSPYNNYTTIAAEGLYLLPGIIDDHVHFREPGLTHKADLHTESMAAVAGGVTSVMEMPNTNPATTTIENWKNKCDIAAAKAHCNFAFYLAATNTNLEEIKKADTTHTPGIKLFLGSSTGNMLVNNQRSLEQLFKESPLLIGIHAEDEQTVQENLAAAKAKYGNEIPAEIHASIRSTEACVKSTSFAIDLAVKTNARIQIFHISSADELALFSDTPLTSDKRITAEVCIPHLWHHAGEHSIFGHLIKVNPSIKEEFQREQLRKAISTNKVDIIATDHAPHLFEEKKQPYTNAPSGGPMIQHSLNCMLELHKMQYLSLEQIVQKMCHAPAIRFGIEKRGYIRKGYYADLTLVNLNKPWTVSKENILYKCNWSTLEGYTFTAKVIHTFVNGQHVFANDIVNTQVNGEMLTFNQ